MIAQEAPPFVLWRTSYDLTPLPGSLADQPSLTLTVDVIFAPVSNLAVWTPSTGASVSAMVRKTLAVSVYTPSEIVYRKLSLPA